MTIEDSKDENDTVVDGTTGNVKMVMVITMEVLIFRFFFNLIFVLLIFEQCFI